MICEFCLKNKSISKISDSQFCSLCKSLHIHYKISSGISKHEYFLVKRPKIDLKYINVNKTKKIFGYSPLDILPFSSKKINAFCRFCHNDYDVMISTLARKNWKSCCNSCAQISSSYSRSKSRINEHEYFLDRNLDVKKHESKSKYDSSFLDNDLTEKTFGYCISSLKPKSNKRICVRCEFCLANINIRRSRLESSSHSICCRSCVSILSVYLKKGKLSNKHEFYLDRRPNINTDLIDVNKTKIEFGYDVKFIKPFSRKRIIAKCFICFVEIRPTMDYFVKENCEVTCKSCMRKKTVKTLKKKYGVSSVLDIEHVKNNYKKSSIEKITELVLSSRYKVDYINQFCLDAGDFQYSFDFFVPSCNLLIECQGDYFHNFKENGYSGTPKDKSKSTYVERYTNYKLVWIWEHEIHLGRIHKILDYHIHGSLEPKIEVGLRDLNFRKIQENEAYSFLSQFHYLGNLGSHSKCYGSYFNDKLISVCTFGGTTRNGSNSKIKKFGFSPKNLRELRRFCIRPNIDAENLASYSISKFLSLYKKENPDIETVLSFSDSTVGDLGTIYKASNWKNLGKTSNSYHYFDPKTNKSIHKKTIWNIANRSNMKEKEFVNFSNLLRVSELPKDIWVFSL